MNEDNTIGARLAALRRGRGLTQEQLAGKAGLSLVFVAHLEQGRRSPRLDTLGQAEADGQRPGRGQAAASALVGAGLAMLIFGASCRAGDMPWVLK